MKIAHFVESFSPLSETFIYNIVSSLEEIGYKNYVLTINKDISNRPFDRVYQLKKKRSIFHKVEYAIQRALKNDARLEHLNLLSVKKDLADQISDIQPICIIGHFAPLGITAFSIAEKLRLPLVTICYGYDVSRNLRKKYWAKRYMAQFKHHDALIGISNHICNKLRLLSRQENIHLIHLGVDLSSIRYTCPSYRLTDEMVFVHVGRLVEKKGPLFLIKSFQHTLKNYTGDYQLRLKIIGEGPLRSVCREYIMKNKLEADIELLGALPHEETLSLLGKAHIYAQHSITASDGDEEGQGVTLVEASGLGLPIVTTKHNGFTDVVLEGKTGFLVPERDTRAMSERMLWLANNVESWDQIGIAGTNHMIQEFNLQKETSKLNNIIKQVILN